MQNGRQYQALKQYIAKCPDKVMNDLPKYNFSCHLNPRLAHETNAEVVYQCHNTISSQV